MTEQLPSIGEPLVLADGTKIDPTTGKKIKDRVYSVPNNVEARRKLTELHATIDELPDVTERMNVVNVILTYSFFGLSDADIGIAVGMPLEMVEKIKMTDAYRTMRDKIVDNIQQHEDDLSRTIAGHAASAIAVVVEIMNDDELDAKARLAAAVDVLNRSGYMPKHIVEQRNHTMQSLRIDVVHKTPDSEIPTIDIDPNAMELEYDSD